MAGTVRWLQSDFQKLPAQYPVTLQRFITEGMLKACSYLPGKAISASSAIDLLSDWTRYYWRECPATKFKFLGFLTTAWHKPIFLLKERLEDTTINSTRSPWRPDDICAVAALLFVDGNSFPFATIGGYRLIRRMSIHQKSWIGYPPFYGPSLSIVLQTFVAEWQHIDILHKHWCTLFSKWVW